MRARVSYNQTTVYMESMDEEIKEKIRIQGHKIKSLFLTRSLIQQHRRAWFPYVFPPVARWGEIKSGSVESEAWDGEQERERKKRTKPSSGCFIMIIYFSLSPLIPFLCCLLSALHMMLILPSSIRFPKKNHLAMFHSKVI